MTKISNLDYAQKGEELLSKVRGGVFIPYVKGGDTLSGMDCQGLCEYLLHECGVPKSECDLPGSNSHYRACVWRGTPEECTEKYGSVPAGAWVFIVDPDDSGAPEQYRGDGYGDANHMGVVLEGCAIHASASRGCVAESKFTGKTIPNGGWNMIGFPQWVDYGVGDTSGGGCDNETGNQGGGEENDNNLSIGVPPSSSKEKYATVVSPNGYPVKLRKSPSQQEPVYWLVNPQARVRVEKREKDWSLIVAICSDGYMRRAYMMNAFLEVDA